ncbi:MAG TPA: LemA family protein [Candidatus Poseidoniales archaeon]|jgi:LemA protein|nr:LemA family protein [Candidatus Poseidoniales archaeon]
MDMNMEAVIGIIAVVLFVLFLIWFIQTSNRLIILDENVELSWRNIDVLLKQRYDMIPNLVETVKGYAEHESEIWNNFAEARNMGSSSLASGNMAGVSKAESMLAGMMPRINAVMEQYPELKADSSFADLRKQLVGLENQIADRREYFNASATSYNKVIRLFPTTIVATVKGNKKKDLFIVEGIERENVKIQF